MTIQSVLKKAKQRNVKEGHCFFCDKPIINGRKNQKYHTNCVDDMQRYGIKAKFKNHRYMYIYLGTGYERGQGKRSGNMVKGAMSVAQDMWSEPVPVTIDNVKRSLELHREKIQLCNGTWLKAEEALILASYFDKNKDA